jgi:hypothetical protein
MLSFTGGHFLLRVDPLAIKRKDQLLPTGPSDSTRNVGSEFTVPDTFTGQSNAALVAASSTVPMLVWPSVPSNGVCLSALLLVGTIPSRCQ